MRKYEKQLHELFHNSPHLTFLSIMKRGEGLTTKSGITGFLYFTDSQLDLRFDSVIACVNRQLFLAAIATPVCT